MKKEDWEAGNKLQSSIKEIENKIIRIIDGWYPPGKFGIPDKFALNTEVEYLNQLYRVRVLPTLEKRKKDLEKEFEILANTEFTKVIEKQN